MERNTSVVSTENYGFNPYLYIIYSNAILLYGIWVLGWPFFPIMYLLWWEELIGAIFFSLSWGQVKKRAADEEAKKEALANQGTALFRLFFLSVYLVFIIVMGIFMMGGMKDMAVFSSNIMTLSMRNWGFDAILLGFTLMLGINYYNFVQANAPSTQLKTDMLTPQIITLHIGIIFSALALFVFPEQYQRTGFATIFIGIKIIIALLVQYNGGKIGSSTTTQV